MSSAIETIKRIQSGQRATPGEMRAETDAIYEALKPLEGLPASNPRHGKLKLKKTEYSVSMRFVDETGEPTNHRYLLPSVCLTAKKTTAPALFEISAGCPGNVRTGDRLLTREGAVRAVAGEFGLLLKHVD